ncbi:MAG TPA: DinB family protein [Terriglobia bacterium]|nr:DinB family protein [Terriglobia bacterium]
MAEKIDTDQALRNHLIELLDGGSAHLTFEKAVGGLPAKLRGAKAAGAPHSPWQLLEHLRIAQEDILEFSVDPKHVSPAWPKGYWPETEAPPRPKAWENSIKKFRADLAAMKKLVTSRSTNLFTPIPHGEGQTILREVLLVADHNAYHLGQLVLLRRLLGAWKDD